MLLSLQLSGEASPEELEELDALCKENSSVGLRVQAIRNIWQQKRETEPVNKSVAFDKHLQRLSNHFSAPALQYESSAEDERHSVKEIEVIKTSKKYKWLWPSAAVAASLLAFFIFINRPQKNKSTNDLAKNTVSTRPGSKTKLQLPDGTVVLLNADSRITYNPEFNNGIREVQLTGEAYFDVVKDHSRPFIIHTSSIDIKVLGTAFNVRSYPGEKTTETALIRGTVEIVLHNNPDKKIILKPSEKLVVSNNITAIENPGKEEQADEETMMTLSKIHLDKKDSSSAETKWTRSELDFEGTSFVQIISELERLYNVKFEIKDETFKKLRFTGVFENNSLAEIMEALRFSGKFNYDFKEGKVTVW